VSEGDPPSTLTNSGRRLLALPGLSDSIAARTATVQSYMSHCLSFLIAAPSTSLGVLFALLCLAGVCSLCARRVDGARRRLGLVWSAGFCPCQTARHLLLNGNPSSCSLDRFSPPAFWFQQTVRRAIDDNTARELLWAAQLRRQLLLDGRGGSVVFAATATGDLDALDVAAALVVKGVATCSGISEAVVSLRAHAPDVRLIRRRVTSIADMQMQLTQRLRRDTSSLQKLTTALAVGARDTFRLRKAISRVKARIRKLDTDLGRIREVADKATIELGQREHIINHLCATARNAFCRTQWRMGFAQGMRKGDGGERHVE